MSLSAFDLFPSGSGRRAPTPSGRYAPPAFGEHLERKGTLQRVGRVGVTLYGSLAATAAGHGTLDALVLGLLGERPETVEPVRVGDLLSDVRRTGRLAVLGRHSRRANGCRTT